MALRILKKFRGFFAFCVYRRARCLSMMAVIIIFIHMQKRTFCDRFLYTQKKILFTYRISRALLSNKIVFAFLQKVNNSIAIKLCVNLINNSEIILKGKWRTTQFNN